MNFYKIKRDVLVNLVMLEMFTITIKEHPEIYTRAVLIVAKNNPELFKEVTGYAEVQEEDNQTDGI